MGAHPTNLPPRLPVLIGEDHDVIALAELVTSPEVSVVTLVGPGGTGKTRLSLAVAAVALSSFADGAFFVDLSALSDSSLVIASIAQALSLRETPNRSLEENLADHLASKEMLLVLDNLEQVMGAASQLSSLLEGASALKVLVTSREALRIAGERVVSVAPLGVPSPANSDVDEVASFPAVALFVARAQAVRGDFSLGEDNAADVADICRRLDGLPLALELAAARINLLSPSSLLSRLDQGLKVLSAGRRDASDRQRTLRGAIAWSYELLSEDEQRLFRRLAVFAGGSSLESAEAVCDRDDLELDVLDGLASLVDKSLVRAASEDERFSMFETIREFALGMLMESGEAEEIRRGHAEFFRALIEEAEPHLVGAREAEWVDRLERDHDNLRAAVDWALPHQPSAALRMSAHLWRFWYIRGYLDEGRRRLLQVLTVVPEDESFERAQALRGAGTLTQVAGDIAHAIPLCQQALELYKHLDDKRGQSACLNTLGISHLERGEMRDARRHFERAGEIDRELDDVRGISITFHNLANVAWSEGDPGEAKRLLKKSRTLKLPVGDEEGDALTLANLAFLELATHDVSAANAAIREGLGLVRKLGEPEATMYALEAGAAVLAARGRASLGGAVAQRGGANPRSKWNRAACH